MRRTDCEVLTEYLPNIPGIDQIGIPAEDIDHVLRFKDDGKCYTREGFYYFQDAEDNTLCIEQLWRTGYYQIYYPGMTAYDMLVDDLHTPQTRYDGKLRR